MVLDFSLVLQNIYLQIILFIQKRFYISEFLLKECFINLIILTQQTQVDYYTL